MGQVCARHNEYYEDRCRWCEAPETDAVGLGMAIGECSIFGIMNLPYNYALSPQAKAYDERLRRAMTTPKPVCDHSKAGICAGCGADILLVSWRVPAFPPIQTMAEVLGAEVIGPGESKYWMDFINTRYAIDDPAMTPPNDGHGIFE